MGLNGIPLSTAAKASNRQVRFTSHRTQPWYMAYMAALFEIDRVQVSERISHAERLIIQREHDLFMSESERNER
jgi:hypothetical protein